MIHRGEYVQLFEREWRDQNDLTLRINDWDVIRVEDNEDPDVDDVTFFTTEIDKLISELLTAKRRLREHLDQQAT